jgi:seryl-tRNA synthetase
MIDIRLLRENPDEVAAALARRGVTQEQIDQLIELDARRRDLITSGDELRAEQRNRSKEIGAAPKEDRPGLIDQVQHVSARLSELEPQQNEAETALRHALARIPNLPHPDAPDGVDEFDAVERAEFGVKPTFDFPVQDHVEIGERLGLIDVERGVKVSGSRFAFLLGQAVLLEFALVRFAFDHLAPHGFTPVVPPVLTREDALFGTAFLPTGAEQLYHIPKDDLYLVGTAEVPLAGMHADEILDADQLPLRYAGFSTCFRREAGTYGKDTSGIFRVHQFDKVEMFSYTRPGDAEAEHALMRDIEVSMFEKLGLHGKVMDIPVGDLGDSATRKFDCEVWLPGQQAYRELTSTSNCTDYQARRLRCRYRTDDGSTAMVYTLNGTTVAVSRMIIALLENHQRSDGKVSVPVALQPYLGMEVIG